MHKAIGCFKVSFLYAFIGELGDWDSLIHTPGYLAESQFFPGQVENVICHDMTLS